MHVFSVCAGGKENGGGKVMTVKTGNYATEIVLLSNCLIEACMFKC